MLKKVPIVVLNRLKPSKITLGFQMTIKSSGRSFVDSLNRATKINKVVNRLMVAIGALIHAEIFKIVVKRLSYISYYQYIYLRHIPQSKPFGGNHCCSH